MKNSIVKLLISFLLPIAVIIIAGKINIWYGIAAAAIYIAIAAYFSRATIYALIGSRNYGKRDLDKALKWFKKAYAANRSNIKTAVSYAYILLRSGQPSEAEEILRNLLKKDISQDDESYIKSNLALAIWKNGNLDEAVAMLEEVIKTYKTTSVYGSLGYLLIAQGDLEKALKLNLEAYEYNSSDKIIRDNLGQNYYLLGMNDKAKEIYEPLISQSPAFPEPYYNYGLVLAALGDKQAGISIMKKALNFKFSYLSTVSKEEIEKKLKELGEEQ
jgi:tetratricopeptide (TPR) repeat protein